MSTDNALSPDVRVSKPKSTIVTDSLSTGIAVMLVLTIVQRVVGLLRQIVVCKILDPEELGRWNLAFSMIVLAAPMIVLGIPGTFGRYAEHFRQRGQLKNFLGRTSRATVMLTFAGAAILMLFAKPVAWLLFRDPEQDAMIRLLALCLVSVIGFNYFIEALTSLRQVRAVSWLRFAFSVLFALISLGLVCCFRSTAVSIVLGYAAACLVTSLIGAIVLWRTLGQADHDTSRPTTKALWSKLLPFAGWLWLADLLSNLFAAVDRYMIVHFADSTAAAAAGTVGQYHSSRLIPVQMIALATMSAAILLPYLSSNWESGERKTVHERLNLTVKIYALAMTAIGVALIVVAPWLFDTVFDGKYAEGLQVTPWSVVACIWYGLYLLAQTYLLCCERTRYSSVALTIGLVANVALNAILLPILGLTGAVIATAIANGLALCLIFRFAKSFGMKWSRGVLITAMLPICLVHNPMFALAISAVVAVAGWFTPILFTTGEKEQLFQQFQAFSARFGGFKRLAWSFRRSTQPTS